MLVNIGNVCIDVLFHVCIGMFILALLQSVRIKMSCVKNVEHAYARRNVSPCCVLCFFRSTRIVLKGWGVSKMGKIS